MARSVAVLGTESGAEGIDLAKRGGAELTLQLAADSEGGELAKEVLLPVDGAVFLAGRVLGVESRDVEHLAGTLAVAGGDERRMEVEETALVEESVDGLLQHLPRGIAERSAVHIHAANEFGMIEAQDVGDGPAQGMTGHRDAASKVDPITVLLLCVFNGIQRILLPFRLIICLKIIIPK